jgi:hypothetical protein
MYVLLVRQLLQASARQHLCDRAHVGLMHIHCTTQMALVLGGLLGQENTNADPIVTNTTDMTSFSIGIKPLSFEYGINKRLAITMSFGDLYYGMDTETYTLGTVEVKDTYKGFNLNANYGASFGIRIYL